MFLEMPLSLRSLEGVPFLSTSLASASLAIKLAVEAAREDYFYLPVVAVGDVKKSAFIESFKNSKLKFETAFTRYSELLSYKGTPGSHMTSPQSRLVRSSLSAKIKGLESDPGKAGTDELRDLKATLAMFEDDPWSVLLSYKIEAISGLITQLSEIRVSRLDLMLPFVADAFSGTPTSSDHHIIEPKVGSVLSPFKDMALKPSVTKTWDLTSLTSSNVSHDFSSLLFVLDYSKLHSLFQTKYSAKPGDPLGEMFLNPERILAYQHYVSLSPLFFLMDMLFEFSRLEPFATYARIANKRGLRKLEELLEDTTFYIHPFFSTIKRCFGVGEMYSLDGIGTTCHVPWELILLLQKFLKKSSGDVVDFDPDSSDTRKALGLFKHAFDKDGLMDHCVNALRDFHLNPVKAAGEAVVKTIGYYAFGTSFPTLPNITGFSKPGVIAHTDGHRADKLTHVCTSHLTPLARACDGTGPLVPSADTVIDPFSITAFSNVNGWAPSDTLKEKQDYFELERPFGLRPVVHVPSWYLDRNPGLIDGPACWLPDFLIQTNHLIDVRRIPFSSFENEKKEAQKALKPGASPIPDSFVQSKVVEWFNFVLFRDWISTTEIAKLSNSLASIALTNNGSIYLEKRSRFVRIPLQPRGVVAVIRSHTGLEDAHSLVYKTSVDMSPSTVQSLAIASFSGTPALIYDVLLD